VTRFRVPASPAAARRVQERLRSLVVPRGEPKADLVAGVDVSEKDDVARAAVVVLDRALRVVEEIAVERPVPFPYVPGLLSFREIPSLLAAWRRLKSKPGLVVVDGQGLAHPRRFGIASHLGVILDLPTIGSAKSLLVGEYAEPARERGAWSALIHRDETVGSALRTREGCGVLFVSVGHRISLPSARRWILRLAPRYRLPEPQRLADRLSKRRTG
jgi:deoxyribonuclease V